jgi:hypothetical protein
MAMTTRYTTIDGEIISQSRGGVEHGYIPDPSGSVVALQDSTGAVTDRFDYWPYGEVRTRTGTTTIPFQHQGVRGYYQDSAARAYVRARHLNMAQGRWLTRDPLPSALGVRRRTGPTLIFRRRARARYRVVHVHLDGRSLYEYCRSNPIALTDPTGLQGTIPYPVPPFPVIWGGVRGGISIGVGEGIGAIGGGVIGGIIGGIVVPPIVDAIGRGLKDIWDVVRKCPPIPWPRNHDKLCELNDSADIDDERICIYICTSAKGGPAWKEEMIIPIGQECYPGYVD